MLASLLYPYDDDAAALIGGWLDDLEQHACIVRYEVGGSTYLEICNWLKHQKIDKPSASKIPPIVEGSRTFSKPREASTTDLGPRTMDLGIEEKQVSPLSETASPPRTQKAPPEDFLEFWKAYPTDPIMSRKEALSQWNKLTPEERAAASAAVPAFVTHCRANPDYRPVHACRFLSQRRFEGFQQQQAPPGPVVGGETPRERAIRMMAEMQARDAENERINHADKLLGNADGALPEPARRSCDDPSEKLRADTRGGAVLGDGRGKVVHLSAQQGFSQNSLVLDGDDTRRKQGGGYGPLR
jgi:hypothetical protein